MHDRTLHQETKPAGVQPIDHYSIYKISVEEKANQPIDFIRKTWEKRRFERIHSNNPPAGRLQTYRGRPADKHIPRRPLQIHPESQHKPQRHNKTRPETTRKMRKETRIPRTGADRPRNPIPPHRQRRQETQREHIHPNTKGAERTAHRSKQTPTDDNRQSRKIPQNPRGRSMKIQKHSKTFPHYHNHKRPHQALDHDYPAEMYTKDPPISATIKDSTPCYLLHLTPFVLRYSLINFSINLDLFTQFSSQ